MPDPFLVIVHGQPATGKTTIARYLAKALSLPLITKDEIKELLFDSLGWSDRAWSRKLGAATYDVLYYVAESLLQTGSSLMIESNFNQESNKHFLAIAERSPFFPVQVICQSSTSRRIDRFRRRGERGQRHPGHVDPVVIGEMSLGEDNEIAPPMPLGGEVIEIDTNDFQSIDLDSVVERLSRILGPRSARQAKTPEQ